MPRIKTIEIKCRFDGTVLGKLELNEELWKRKHGDEDPLKQFEDSRCNSCVAAFGNFKKMKHKFLKQGTEEQFIAHMKINDYKNTRLQDALLNLQERKHPDAPRINVV